MHIDGHVHLGRWSDEAFLGVGASIEEIDRAMIEAGLDGAVLTATDLKRNEAVLSAVEARRTRERASYSSPRYWFFPWIDANDASMIEFVHEQIGRIDGLKFHPSLDRLRVTDSAYAPFLEKAALHRLPILLHCGRWQEMASYAFGLELAASHPQVDFVLAHLGGDDPRLRAACIEEVAGGDLGNACLDIAGVREYWMLERALERVGSERVIFGSDFPLGHPRMYRALLETLHLPREVEDAVMGGNLLRLLSRRHESA